MNWPTMVVPCIMTCLGLPLIMQLFTPQVAVATADTANATASSGAAAATIATPGVATASASWLLPALMLAAVAAAAGAVLWRYICAKSPIAQSQHSMSGGAGALEEQSPATAHSTPPDSSRQSVLLPAPTAVAPDVVTSALLLSTTSAEDGHVTARGSSTGPVCSISYPQTVPPAAASVDGSGCGGVDGGTDAVPVRLTSVTSSSSITLLPSPFDNSDPDGAFASSRKAAATAGGSNSPEAAAGASAATAKNVPAKTVFFTATAAAGSDMGAGPNSSMASMVHHSPRSDTHSTITSGTSTAGTAGTPAVASPAAAKPGQQCCVNPPGSEISPTRIYNFPISPASSVEEHEPSATAVAATAKGKAVAGAVGAKPLHFADRGTLEAVAPATAKAACTDAANCSDTTACNSPADDTFPATANLATAATGPPGIKVDLAAVLCGSPAAGGLLTAQQRAARAESALVGGSLCGVLAPRATAITPPRAAGGRHKSVLYQSKTQRAVYSVKVGVGGWWWCLAVCWWISFCSFEFTWYMC